MMREAFSSASATTARASASAALRCSAATVGGQRGGVGAALLEELRELGAHVGADRGGLLRGGRVRGLADLRGGRLGGDQLELRGQPSLAQGGDGLAPQPLDLLLRAATLAGVLVLRHRGPRLRTSGPRWRAYGTDRAGSPERADCPACTRLLALPFATVRARGGWAPPHRHRRGRSCSPPAPPPAPGGSVSWSPTGRQALGRPVLYTGSANGAFVAWMDPQLTKLAVVPGTGDPLGSPWGGQVSPAEQPFLVVVVQRRVQVGRLRRRRDRVRRVVPQPGRGRGVADRVRRRQLHGRRVGPRQRPGQAGRRAAPEPRHARRRRRAHSGGVEPRRVGWRRSPASPPRAVAVGVDANGGLVWAGGRVSPLDLANALIAAGAVRGMQLDINPDWVGFNSTTSAPTTSRTATASTARPAPTAT